MAIAEGDFRAVEEKVTTALLADTGAGGLFETGGGGLAVARPGDEALAETLVQADYPAALVRAEGKREEPLGPAFAALKVFSLRVVVAMRSPDRLAAEARVRRIAARIEEVIRRQNRADQQLGGLADAIADGEGVLFTLLLATEFPKTDAGPGQVLARARVQFEVRVPCAFLYE